jgi:hypothetical protein
MKNPTKAVYPLPMARPSEFNILSKPFNKHLLQRFKAQKECMRKLEKIFNAMVLGTERHEDLWTRIYLTLVLQMATTAEEARSIIQEAQGVLTHKESDAWFTTDDDKDEVKEVQQVAIVRAATKTPRQTNTKSQGSGKGNPKDAGKFSKRKGVPPK